MKNDVAWWDSPFGSICRNVLTNESTSLNYLNDLGNMNISRNIARTRFACPKTADNTKSERIANRHYSASNTFGNYGGKKMFPRSESLEAFPPLTRNFIKRRQSRSP